MTCADVLSDLDDYVDGELSEAAFQEMELHLETCSACREQERLLRALLAHAAAMPRLLDPPRDLWPGIAERLAEPAGGGGRTVAFWAAAAAAVLALSSGIHVRPGTPGASPEPRREGRLVQASLSTSPPLIEAEAGYVRATEELAAALESRRASLSPETLQVVDENLRIINEALRSVREALEKDPGNHELTRMLLSTHKKKVEILRRATFLT